MARLILLNGPPGCGKSTLAQMYAQDHRLALNLDVDRVRGLIGQWKDNATNAGLLARKLALAMAEVHLTAGHDVIVPQYLGRPEFVEQLERLGAAVDVAFHEVVLLDSKQNAVRRFQQRAATNDPVHVDAQLLVDRSGGQVYLEAMHEKLVALLKSRPHAVIIVPADGEDVRRTYRKLVDHLR